MKAENQGLTLGEKEIIDRALALLRGSRSVKAQGKEISRIVDHEPASFREIPSECRQDPRGPISLEDGRRLYQARGWLVIDSRTLGRRVLLARDEEAARTGEQEAARILGLVPPVVFEGEIPRLKDLGTDELRRVLGLTPAERELVLHARELFHGEVHG